MRVAALIALGVMLTSCGTISAAVATRDWTHQSNYAYARHTLVGDATHAREALRDPLSSSAALHTVCGVLNVDALAANSSLPTPDAQSTHLLGDAYQLFGDGANTCYDAGHDVATRARAVGYLQRAVIQLSLATIRLAVAAGQ